MLNESDSLPIVNQFCQNMQKLKDLVDREGKGSDEWKSLINTMRYEYRIMWWKHQKHLEKWRDMLSALGFYDKEADFSVDVSDLEKSEEVEVEGKFHYTTPVISEKGNVTYQYNEFSIPRDELPEDMRREIYEKSMRNAKATSQGIVQGIQGNGRGNISTRQPQRWGLVEGERDWS